MTPDGRKSETFESTQEMLLVDQLPAYATHSRDPTISMTASTTTATTTRYHD
jgi:hypothetical protein